MKIGVSGYFGYQNLGDEIFLKVWEDLFSGHQVFPLCGYEDLSTLDSIIIGGGDLIIPNKFTSAYWRENFLDLPTWVYGVGVPTRLKAVPEVCNKYKSFLNKCEGVFVRDRKSKDWLIENNVYNKAVVVNDIAWNYDMSEVSFNKSNKKTVGISIRQQSIFDIDNIIKLVSYLAENMNILMIPLQPGYEKSWNDRYLHEDLKKEVLKRVKGAKIDIIPPFCNIEQRIKFIEIVDLYITERMHGMLMSLRVGTPVMPIAVGNKFFRIMERFGLEDMIVDSKNYEKMKKVIKQINKVGFSSTVKKIEKETESELNNFKKMVLNKKKKQKSI